MLRKKKYITILMFVVMIKMVTKTSVVQIFSLLNQIAQDLLKTLQQFNQPSLDMVNYLKNCNCPKDCLDEHKSTGHQSQVHYQDPCPFCQKEG